MKWTKSEEQKLITAIQNNCGITEIRILLNYRPVGEIREKANQLGLEIIKEGVSRKGVIDEYDKKVMQAVKAGCKDIYEVVKYTTFRASRIKEINTRLKLKINTDKFDNQCTNMLATSFSRTY